MFLAAAPGGLEWMDGWIGPGRQIRAPRPPRVGRKGKGDPEGASEERARGGRGRGVFIDVACAAEAILRWLGWRARGRVGAGVWWYT